jgi:hypothetical protein
MINVIGEGGFGCVHRPSLKCKTETKTKTKIDYNNKTSKVLLKSEALKELKEYNQVKKIDKDNDFYLGVPKKCTPDTSLQSNIDAFNMCKISKETSLHKTELFIMNDGGENIKQYVATMNKWNLDVSSLAKCELFLLEALRLFRALLVFNEHCLIHFDLKPHNVVYNETINRLNIIDFGLLIKKTDILERAKKSSYHKRFWFNHPWEISYLKQIEFDKIKPKGETEFDNVIKVMQKSGTHEYKHVNTFMSYIIEQVTVNEGSKLRQDKYDEFLNRYKHFFTTDLANKNYTYDIFSNKLLDTIDSYGLGFTLLHWLREAKRFFLFDGDTYKLIVHDLEKCFTNMINPWQGFRSLISESIVEFEEIVKRSGILEKYHKKIVNHELVNENAKVDASEKPFVAKVPKNFKPDEKIENSNPNDCPDGKERNPKTNRCVNVCKDGQYRNHDFKCLKKKEVGIKKEQKEQKEKEKQEVVRLKLEQKEKKARDKQEEIRIQKEQKEQAKQAKKDNQSTRKAKTEKQPKNNTRKKKTNVLYEPSFIDVVMGMKK